MSLRKKAIARMKEHEKKLIYGYFRRISKALHSSTPPLVRHICAAYYIVSDEFDVHQKHDAIVMTDNNTCIHHNVASWNTIVGANVCEKGDRYQWTLRIVDVMESTSNTWKILIGIIKNDNCKALFAHGRRPKKRYFTSIPGSFGFIGSAHAITTHGQIRSYHGQRFEKKNDCIVVDLDMRKDVHTLSFVINGKEYGKAFDVDKNEKYRLAVSVCKGRRVKLCNMEVMDKEVELRTRKSLRRIRPNDLNSCLGRNCDKHKCIIC